MKRLCIITECIPSPTSKHGVFKRLGVFLQAFKDKANIDFLFYPRHDQLLPEEELRILIEEVWAIKANVIIQQPKGNCRNNLKSLSSFLCSLTDFKQQDNYKNICGPEQIAGLDNYLNTHQPDLIFAHRLSTMAALLSSSVKPLPPIIFDLDDIEHISYAREISRPPKWLSKNILYFQIPALMLGEKKATKLAAKTFVCSDSDAKYLSRIYRSRTIYSIPNAIEIPKETTIPGTELAVLFIGTYVYQPNVEAAEYLITAVWPEILKHLPQARLYIAGNHAENIPSYKQKPKNVVFTGFVEELAELYSKVKIMCCPIFAAGGTRIKIIEAAAFGKAIVSTKIGAEGLDFIDGKDIFIKNNLKELVDCCVELLQNDDAVAEIGREAKKRVCEHYDKEAIVRSIKHTIDDLI